MFLLRNVPGLRYGIGIFAMCLVSVGVVAVGQGQSETTTDTTTKTDTSTDRTAANQPKAPSPPKIEKMEPVEVPRGGGVTFIGENLPENAKDITVFLNGSNQGSAVLVSPDKKSFIFVVPSSLTLGKYNVRVDIKLKDNPVPFTPQVPPDATLTVYGEAGKQAPKIVAVSPLLSYPEKEIYGFTVLGEGFSAKKGTDNGLVVANRGEIPICWLDDPNCQPNDPKLVYGKVVSDREIRFSGIPQKHQGLNGIQIRVGQEHSNTFDITLSRVSRSTPIAISLIVFFALAFLIFIVLKRALKVRDIAGRKYNVLQSLLLDKETDTYSLSRFQFYVWTTAAILGYLYLILSRSLVQWKLEFVDIPSGLPGIILVSASTTILAQSITNSKGPKGTGDIHPTIADLVTTGGLAVPERFQFFLWTVVGALVFLFLVFASDPGTIKDLPTIPTGFLEIMGVSSLGYLGGKLARKAGPVIDEIVARTSSLELELHGRNLSKDASFQIGTTDIPLAMVEGGKPKIVEADSDVNMAKVLLLKIKDPVPPEWLADNSKLTIINPDGQTASWEYSLKAAEEAAASAGAEAAATETVAKEAAATEAAAKGAAATEAAATEAAATEAAATEAAAKEAAAKEEEGENQT